MSATLMGYPARSDRATVVVSACRAPAEMLVLYGKKTLSA